MFLLAIRKHRLFMKSILSIVTAFLKVTFAKPVPLRIFFLPEAICFHWSTKEFLRSYIKSFKTTGHNILVSCYLTNKMQNHTFIIIELGVCASRHPSSEFRKITISSEQIICCFAGRFFAAANLKCCAICTPSGCPRGDAHSQQVASSSNHLDQWFSTDSMIL